MGGEKININDILPSIHIDDSNSDKRNKDKICNLLENIKIHHYVGLEVSVPILFIKTSEKIQITCQYHGVFHQSLYRLAKGYGCCRCSAEKRSREVHTYYKGDSRLDGCINILYGVGYNSVSIVQLPCWKCNSIIEMPLGNKRKGNNTCIECNIKDKSYEINRKLNTIKNRFPEYVISSVGEEEIGLICPIHGEFNISIDNPIRQGDKSLCSKCFRKNSFTIENLRKNIEGIPIYS